MDHQLKKYRQIIVQLLQKYADIPSLSDPYCIALLMIHRLTDYKIIRQAKRQTGFDYWLGDQKEAYPYTEKARLEVSGLLKGKLKQINWRVKSKFQQSEQSNDLQLPIYVIITEFSKPISKMLEK
jgi:hypothetical protein